MSGFESYLPWWIGGAALVVVPVIYGCRRFGVSGIFEKVLFRKETIDVAESAAFAENEKLLKASLQGQGLDPEEVRKVASHGKSVWMSGLALIVGLMIGGGLDAILFSSFSSEDLVSPKHTALFGEGGLALGILFVGGLFVGWGTRLSGGCTSGHGLSGCGQVQKNSYLATAVFFGAAILTTLALNSWMGAVK